MASYITNNRITYNSIMKDRGLTIALGFNVLKNILPLFPKKIKTTNNAIIRGKWQKK